MNYPPFNVRELIKTQNELTVKVKLQKLEGNIETIAACDSSIMTNKILSVFVLMKFPSLEIIDTIHEVSPLILPYIPGFLAFREIPNLLKAYKKLKIPADVIFVDGHGISHPRGLGIASHLGVLINKPTIGIAKKLLVGKYEIPGELKGSVSEIFYKDKKIGICLRSKDKVKPVFISPGNLLNFEDCLNLTMNVLGKYRLPEPVRIADKLSKDLKSRYN